MRAALVSILACFSAGFASMVYALAPSDASANSSLDTQASSPAHGLALQDVELWLDGFLPYALQRGDVAGAAIVIVKQGQVLFQKGYGYADVASKTPLDPTRTLLRPGSISKLFTWTAVMQQLELGRLNLDADVNTYLDFKIPARDGRPVTLRNLMTHTGGFEETLENAETSNPSDLLPLDRYMRVWVPERVFPPGKIPAYSNYGTALAGYIVERVSGEPFTEYVQRHIFDPLDMKGSTFVQPLPERFRPFMAKGYRVASGPPMPYQLFGVAPAGALAATGADMSHFMIAQLEDGAYGNGRILKAETARLMHETALTILPAVHRMLLGFYEKSRNGHRVIAHDGDTALFHSAVYLYPDDGVGLFISMNSTGKDAAAYAIREALFQQFTDRYFPGPTPDGHVDAKEAQSDARLIAGEYRSSRRSQSNFLSVLGLMGSTSVRDNGDGTISVSDVDGINGESKQWREIAPFVWREMDGKERLAALVENGKVAMFSYDEISPFMVFLPVPALSSPAGWLKLLELSLTILIFTVILWPVAALMRRRYSAAFPLVGHDLVAYRAVRLAVLLVLAALLGWVWTFMGFISGALPLTAQTDPWLLTLHLISIVTFAGAFAVAIWGAWRTWHGKRGWLARLWSLLVVVSLAVVFWVGFVYKLLGFRVHY